MFGYSQIVWTLKFCTALKLSSFAKFHKISTKCWWMFSSFADVSFVCRLRRFSYRIYYRYEIVSDFYEWLSISVLSYAKSLENLKYWREGWPYRFKNTNTNETSAFHGLRCTRCEAAVRSGAGASAAAVAPLASIPLSAFIARHDGRSAKFRQNVARFRLYRDRFLQENMRFAAFFKIYQIIELKFLKFGKFLQILRQS